MTELTEQEKWLDEVERFISEIRKFLAERFGSGDSWTNIPADLWTETNNIIYKLLRMKFRPDCDNDSNVEFFLVDRSKQRFIYSFPAGRYTHKMKSVEEIDREISNAVSTLKQASERIQELTVERERFLEEESKSKLTLDKK